MDRLIYIKKKTGPKNTCMATMTTWEIEPHISETNATGHIDNATVPAWLERARSPIYRIFNPDLSPRDWNLIIKRLEIDFIKQIRYQDKIIINSCVNGIRNTSFSVVQEIVQNNEIVARSKVVLVYYDYTKHQKMEIPAPARSRLQELKR